MSAEQATDVSITSYTGVSSYQGFMMVFINGECTVIQDSGDGNVMQTVHLAAGQSITVLATNTAAEQGPQDYGHLTDIIFRADVPLTVTKTATDPEFRHPYTSGNAYTYADSDLRGFLEQSVYAELPAELKAGIKNVVNQQAAYDVENSAMFAQTTEDRLWVPSYNELLHSNVSNNDGTSRLGNGMYTAINGFGSDKIWTRTVSAQTAVYMGSNNDPQYYSHGGQTTRPHVKGMVYPCFAL